MSIGRCWPCSSNLFCPGISLCVQKKSTWAFVPRSLACANLARHDMSASLSSWHQRVPTGQAKVALCMCTMGKARGTKGEAVNWHTRLFPRKRGEGAPGVAAQGRASCVASWGSLICLPACLGQPPQGGEFHPPIIHHPPRRSKSQTVEWLLSPRRPQGGRVPVKIGPLLPQVADPRVRGGCLAPNSLPVALTCHVTHAVLTDDPRVVLLVSRPLIHKHGGVGRPRVEDNAVLLKSGERERALILESLQDRSGVWVWAAPAGPRGGDHLDGGPRFPAESQRRTSMPSTWVLLTIYGFACHNL